VHEDRVTLHLFELLEVDHKSKTSQMSMVMHHVAEVRPLWQLGLQLEGEEKFRDLNMQGGGVQQSGELSHRAAVDGDGEP